MFSTDRTAMFSQDLLERDSLLGTEPFLAHRDIGSVFARPWCITTDGSRSGFRAYRSLALHALSITVIPLLAGR